MRTITAEMAKRGSDFWFSSAEDAPRKLLDILDISGRRPYVMEVLSLGRSNFFEPLRRHQPKTCAVLEAGSELFVYGHYNDLSASATVPHIGIEVRGRLVAFLPCSARADRKSPKFKESFVRRQESLPDPLCAAYYSRFNGMSFPATPKSFDQCVLPMDTSSGWIPVDAMLSRYRLKSAHLPALGQLMPDVVPVVKSEQYLRFMAFLSTGSPGGKDDRVFDLFVRVGCPEKNVFAILNGDLPNMRILNDPVGDIDEYCADVLIGELSGFDFFRDARPLPVRV